MPSTLASADVAIVGAGIVGLAHAYEAHRQGASVVVIDRASSIQGASVRNFGHACITPQAREAAGYAVEARARWRRLASEVGFFVRESGTVVVARSDAEAAVLDEYLTSGAEAVRLSPTEVVDRVPIDPRPVVSGVHLPNDLQVDPREAAPAIARWLERQGVRFLWRTAATGVTSGAVETPRGTIGARRIVVAANHDVDELFPALAEEAGVVRCRLHMLRIRADLRFPLAYPLLTGWSLLRYAGFAAMPSTPALRAQLAAELPEGIAWDLNLMFTARPDGSLIIGDTHLREPDASPFQDEAGSDLVLDQTRRMFGVADIRVLERWQGVYASSPDREFLIAEPEPGVHVVTVTTGIGMTTALGIAPRVLAA